VIIYFDSKVNVIGQYVANPESGPLHEAYQEYVHAIWK